MLAAAQVAAAHPLGNFSINHLTRVKVSNDRVELHYILDQAEIPTFQERGLSDAEVLSRKREAVERGLSLTVDGRPVPLRLLPGAELSFPPGQGGLKLTRVELSLLAGVKGPRRVEVRDETFAGRVGWKAIVAQPGDGTAVQSSAPSGDPTKGLSTYPKNLLQSPLDVRNASFRVRAGNGTITAPSAQGAGETTTKNRTGDGFAGAFSDAAAGQGVLLLLLLVAFGWGALHAISPGHGKAMVAAYLVGTRGTARHAVGLGAIVTFTHTLGVFGFGLVTLLLSQFILPETLYPWLNLIAGLLVLIVGIGVLRSRLRWAGARLARRSRRPHGTEGHGHSHAQADHGLRQSHAQEQHDHGHDHSHAPGSGHGHGDGHHHDHDHGHHHMPERVTWKGLVGMGAAAGILPCPSALVVLLGAIAQHQVALGLVLIVAFSFGLAATLTGLGLAVVYARRLSSRISLPGRLTAALPAASALLIVGIGFVLTAQAIPKVA